MRVETAAGLSPYSNEVTVATLQALPAAPTNLQATPISSSQVNLTWTNNAPDATAIRVEYMPPPSTTFVDIFAAATLTSTGVTNLQPSTTYAFRVRAQNAAGYSAYSNVATVTTLAVPTTVFLLHGIGQSSRDMQSLKQTLASSLDPKKYIVDATFSYVCASSVSCPATCTISNGALQLATQILNSTTAGSRVILVGYSMGGLIARDMIANNYSGVTTSRKITALLTLGTPNLGYPYGSLDTSTLGTLFTGTCPVLSLQMASDFRAQQSTRTVVLWPYLSSLTNQWSSLAPAGGPYWLAVSGGYCKNPIRTLDLTGTLGCPDYNMTSDGVVCDQSARYVLNGPNTPTQMWYGDAYAHAAEVIMCGFFDSAPLLFNPLPGDALSQELIGVISQH
jgi:triacylglycerol esterase/lipase EstA (alpha/beta hydrolase family)